MREQSTATFVELALSTANVRHTAVSKALNDSLAESIAAHGILAPLVVRAVGGQPHRYVIVAGSRRWKAIDSLIKAGRWKVDERIPIVIETAGFHGVAADSSLTENFARAPMHPVDEYEAFAELKRQGMVTSQIAAAYGMDAKHVDQRLALGELHKDIRAAWRGGEIGPSEAQAFTLAVNQKAQLEAFSRLHKAGRLTTGDIRKALVGESKPDQLAMLRLIGMAAAQDAGAQIRPDLFGEAHFIGKPAALAAVARKAIDAERQRLEADGWKWARYAEDIPADRFQAMPREQRPWPQKVGARIHDIERELWNTEEEDERALREERARLKAEALPKVWPRKDRAAYGVVFALDTSGGEGDLPFRYTFGLSGDPDQDAPPRRGGKGSKNGPQGMAQGASRKAAGEPDEKALPQTRQEALSATLTKALALAMRFKPGVALACLIALDSQVYNETPVRVAYSGARAISGPREIITKRGKEASFIDTVTELMAAPDALPAVLSEVVAEAVDARLSNASVRHGDVPAFAKALFGDDIFIHLESAFDAKDYFEGAPKWALVEAARDCQGIEAAASVERAKKTEAVALALAAIKGRGPAWLPPALRLPGYAGPGAKAE